MEDEKSWTVSREDPCTARRWNRKCKSLCASNARAASDKEGNLQIFKYPPPSSTFFEYLVERFTNWDTWKKTKKECVNVVFFYHREM